MDVPDVSLIYPLMMLVQIFTNDYVLSYKILAAILAGTFTVLLFLLALKWTDNYKIALLLGCISLFSPHLTYFAAGYPKNLLGVIFFILLIYVADATRKVIPVSLLVLNFFGHRVTAVLGLLFLLTRGFRPYVLMVFVAVIVAGGFFLPGILSFLDVERFRGVVSGDLQFAPYSFIRSVGFKLISPWWLIEIVACCIIFFTAIVYTIKKHDRQLTSILVILALLIFPFFTWSDNGPAIRFFLIFILLCPLLLIFLLKSTKKSYVLLGTSAAVVVCSFFSYRSYDPAKHDPPYSLYSIVARGITSSIPAGSCELIIAHKSLAEYIVYATGIDAMSWIPEYPIEDARLWRVSEGVKDVQLSFYLDPEDLAFVHRLTPSYVLVPEDSWQKLLRRAGAEGDEELLRELTNWRNPDSVRPKYMLQKKAF